MRLASIPYTTLDYWVRTGLVTPSIQGSAPRQRRPRIWNLRDVLCVRALRELYQSGCSVKQLRAAKKHLDEQWTDRLVGRHLYWGGGDVFMVDEWDRLISLLKEPGQQVIRVVALPLSALYAEIQTNYDALLMERTRSAAKLSARAVELKRARREESA